MKLRFAACAVLVVLLLFGGYLIHVQREANRYWHEEARRLASKIELAKAHTSLLESSIGAAKFDLWLLNSEVRRFRSGENWAHLVPKVEKQINELNLRFVGVNGLQYDLEVLSNTLGREVMDRNLKTSSIDPITATQP